MNSWHCPQRMLLPLPFFIRRSRGGGQFGYTPLLFAWFKVWPLFMLQFERGNFHLRTSVVRWLFNNLDCLCWYYHSSSSMLLTRLSYLLGKVISDDGHDKHLGDFCCQCSWFVKDNEHRTLLMVTMTITDVKWVYFPSINEKFRIHSDSVLIQSFSSIFEIKIQKFKWDLKLLLKYKVKI